MKRLTGEQREPNDNSEHTMRASGEEHNSATEHHVIRKVLIFSVAALLGLSAGAYATHTLRSQSQHNQSASTSNAGAAATTHAARNVLKSTSDFDRDGIDDYSDIVQGAHLQAKAHPKYDDGYYQGGYPPEGKGACTDMVWHAFANAGYDLKAMVDKDIADAPAAYAGVAPSPDPNIDFRRVGVLGVFFTRYGESLTTDTSQHQQWQQGDLVIFDNTWHIGIASDNRDSHDIPLLLHNMGQQQRENDYLSFSSRRPITKHLRFAPEKLPSALRIAWHS
ncbi:DUF1287 domain-containing protein [Bifidobacterium sp.]|uniref:DUF1287 domain-containing protein n=1 Tax=Bifidobacterium sp. TaxID=41200 RepID=UPI0025B9BDCF|nr:DUF1287 domain-containing protein [Bifidobacterium sp.]MCI1635645.1 DUF1287 domain-containing protein [Bifidobacterium sp.]